MCLLIFGWFTFIQLGSLLTGVVVCVLVVSLIYRLFCEQGFVCRAIFNEFCSWLHIWLRSAPLPHSCAVCRFVSHLICRLVFMKYWSQGHNPYFTCESVLDRVRLKLILLLSSIQALYGYISPLNLIWVIFLFWNWNFVSVIHCLGYFMVC